MKIVKILISMKRLLRQTALLLCVFCISLAVAVHAQEADSESLKPSSKTRVFDLDAVMDLSDGEPTTNIEEKVFTKEEIDGSETGLTSLFGQAFKNYVGVDVNGLDQFGALSMLSQKLGIEPNEIKKRFTDPGRTSEIESADCNNVYLSSTGPTLDSLNFGLCISAPFVALDHSLLPGCKVEQSYEKFPLTGVQGLIADISAKAGQSYRLPTALELLAMGPVLSQHTTEAEAAFWSSVAAPESARWAVLANADVQKSSALKPLQATERAFVIPVRTCVASDIVKPNPFAIGEVDSPLDAANGDGLRRIETLSGAELFWHNEQSRSLEQGLSLYVYKEAQIAEELWLLVGAETKAPEGWVISHVTKPWADEPPQLNRFSLEGLDQAMVSETGDGLRRVETMPDAQLFQDAGQSQPLGQGVSLHVFKESDIDGAKWLAVGRRPEAAEGWVRRAATKPWVEPQPANPFSVKGLKQALTAESGEGLRRVATLMEANLVLGIDQFKRLNASVELYVFSESEIIGSRWLAVGEQPDLAEGWIRLELTEALSGNDRSSEESPSFSLKTLNDPMVADKSGFLRRVLTRPGAELKTADEGSMPLDTFSILYVFADRQIRGARWLAVGEKSDTADGWVQFESTEDWKSMLVMQYAPKTVERERTLFFKSKQQLQSIIGDENGGETASAIYDDVARGGNADGRIVTVEPERAVRADQLYLMPILDHEKTYFNYPNWRDVTMLQLAGVTDQSSSQNIDHSESERGSQNQVLKDFIIRIAFVIDTTKSMGPYIEATKTFVRNIYQKLDNLNATENLQVALVGFRDNVDRAPDAGYITKIYRAFDSSGDYNEVIASIDAVEPAKSSTHQWREDAFAGVHRAITDLDWASGDPEKPTGANIIMLITDASARDIGDKLASVPSFGAPTVRSQLNNRGIALHTFHLETKDARDSGNGDIERGASQYGEIDKLYSVRGDTPRAIAESFSNIEESLVYALATYAKGEEVQRSNSIYDQMRDIDIDSENNVITENNTKIASTRILSDIFRFQQEYLGYYEGTKPPEFYRAWVADRDFLNQRQSTMTVAVLISRSQLELLASSIEALLQDLDDKRATYSETYQGTRNESGKASVDPLLPEATSDMLAALPYYSKLLRETAEGFAGLGPSQDVLLNEVRAKLTAYQSILRSERKWIRVSEDARGDDHLYPLPLEDLP